MKVIHINTFKVKTINCCGERLTNVAESKLVKCPKCHSVYNRDGSPAIKIKKSQGEMQISI